MSGSNQESQQSDWSSGAQRKQGYDELIEPAARQSARRARQHFAQGPLRHGERFLTKGMFGAVENSAARDRVIRRGRSAIETLIESTKPHLRVSEVRNLLGVSVDEVRSLARKDRLLGFRTPSGDDILFPAWQFEEGEPVSGLDQVLAAFGASDPLEAVLFFATASPRLDGRRPIDALRDGDVDQVLDAAARHAEHGGR